MRLVSFFMVIVVCIIVIGVCCPIIADVSPIEYHEPRRNQVRRLKWTFCQLLKNKFRRGIPYRELMRYRSNFESKHKGMIIEWGEGTSIIDMRTERMNHKPSFFHNVYATVIKKYPWIKRASVGPRKHRIFFGRLWCEIRRIVVNGIWLYVRYYSRKYLVTVIASLFIAFLITVGVIPEIASIAIIGAVYLDVDAGVDGDGSIGNPFNSWTSFRNAVHANNSGYIKAGTTVNGTNGIWLGYDNITISSYGVGARPYCYTCFDIGADNLTISDIDVDGTGTSPSYLIAQSAALTNLTVYNIDFYNKAAAGLGYPYSGSGAVIHDFTIDTDTSGINIESHLTTSFDDVEIYNFTIDCGLGGTSDGLTIHSNDHTGSGSVDIVIHDGTVSNCAENCLDTTGFGSGQVYNCEFDNGSIIAVYFGFGCGSIAGGTIEGCHFHHCYVHGSTNNGDIGFQCQGPIYCYKNFIYSDQANRGVTMVSTASGEGGAYYYFEGNTVIGGASITTGLLNVHQEFSGSISEALVSNNIWTTTQATAPTMYTFGTFSPTDAFFTSFNNVMYNPAGDPTPCSGYTWTTWNVIHTEGSKDDPMLVDRTLSTYGDARDAYLSSDSSSAYGIASWVLGELTLYKRDGTSVVGMNNVDDYVGSTGCEDIGFYEYDGGGPSPVVTLTLSNVNIINVRLVS